MIKRFGFGQEFSFAVTEDTTCEKGQPEGMDICVENDVTALSFALERSAKIYGLGETVRGINKRGWKYRSYNADVYPHTEEKSALYASHNFIAVKNGKKTFGLFIDCTGMVEYDLGFSDMDAASIKVYGKFDLYIIYASDILSVVKEFRGLIGKSYMPPKWAFGVAQSRWGYRCEEDVRKVAEEYKKAGMPLDIIYLDIDYMDNFKDFTVSKERFPDFKGLVKEMREQGIRIVPIIDAAVKAESGYFVYDEGKEKGYFCKDASGDPYLVGVWPGFSALPDFLSPEAREWFGEKYEILMDQGIEGFWNDMNEPAFFYSKTRLDKLISDLPDFMKEYTAAENGDVSLDVYCRLKNRISELENNTEDQNEFYHNINGKTVKHSEVHNIYGCNMVRAAAEYMKKRDANKRYLIISRSSSIGMHRYGGVWTGDNSSWWSHLLLNIKMLPSLNMAGFMYVGADLGGFVFDTTEDLLMRWLSFGIFVPLMRNHSCVGTRQQEYYNFKNKEVFADILNIREALIPFLYSELGRCITEDDMMYKPLSFVYPEDPRAEEIEDQLIVGDSIMIAPVYEQNKTGRTVYLPEKMKMIRMRSLSDYEERLLPEGDNYVKSELGETVFFILPGKVLPLKKPNTNDFVWLKNIDRPAKYRMLCDDGESAVNFDKDFISIEVTPD